MVTCHYCIFIAVCLAISGAKEGKGLDDTLCQSFNIGQTVEVEDFSVNVPEAVIACSLNVPELVGVCGPPYSGHDQWSRCVGGKPAFCGEKSLFYVRCSGIRSQTDVMSSPEMPLLQPSNGQLSFRGSQVVNSKEPCGCGWNAKHGCVVSASQLIESLSQTPADDAACGNKLNLQKKEDRASSVDCYVRKKVAAAAKKFGSCIGLSARECAEADECEWGAQGSGECGIDEEKLVFQMVDPSERDHPLVKLIMLHDHCSKHNEEWCDADRTCSYQLAGHQATCDVNPSLVISVLLEFPHLALDLQEATAEVMCQSCTDLACCTQPCIWSTTGGGTCELDRSHSMLAPVQDMIQALCQQSARLGEGCPEQCVEKQLENITLCDAPIIPSWRTNTSFPLGPNTQGLVKVLSMLGGRTTTFQQLCNRDLSPQLCKASKPTCSSDDEDLLRKTQKQKGGRSGHVGPGMKGFVKQVAESISEGKAGDLLDSYLENHPDSVEGLTKKALKHLTKILEHVEKEEEREEKQEEKSSQVSETKKQKTRDVKPAVNAHTDDVRASVAVVSEEAVAQQKWYFLVTYALIASIGAGVALGMVVAVCHIRKPQAREPLLGEHADFHGTREQEMTETVPAMMRPS